MPIYPSDYTTPPLQLRRGNTAKVSDYVAAEGELVYNTQTNQIFVGDGVTIGGILVSGESNQTLYTTSSVTFSTLTVVTNIINSGTFQQPHSVNGQNLLIGIRGNDLPLFQPQGTFNTIVGFAAGSSTIDGDNCAYGAYAGSSANGNNNTYLGAQSGMGVNGDNNIFIGYRSGKSFNNVNNNNVILSANYGDGEGFQGLTFTSTFFVSAGNDLRLRVDQNSFYVNPVRSSTSTQILFYNTSTKEITYGLGPDQSLNTTSNVRFQSIVVQSNAAINSLSLGTSLLGTTDVVSINTTTTQTVYEFNFNNSKSGKFIAQITDNGKIHFVEISLVTNGTDVWKVEYGLNTNQGTLGNFSTEISGTQCLLKFTPTITPVNMNIRVIGMLMSI